MRPDLNNIRENLVKPTAFGHFNVGIDCHAPQVSYDSPPGDNSDVQDSDNHEAIGTVEIQCPPSAFEVTFNSEPELQCDMRPGINQSPVPSALNTSSY